MSKTVFLEVKIAAKRFLESVDWTNFFGIQASRQETIAFFILNL
jgi:hypothetical protein